MSYIAQQSQSRAAKPWRSCRFLGCSLAYTAITAGFMTFAQQLLPPEAMHHPSGWKFATLVPTAASPNILVLGSSLTLISAVRADSQAEKGHTRIDEETCFENLNYDKAQYLSTRMRLLGINKSEVLNMSLIASMSSDYLKLLTELVANKYKPQMLVCGIAPRDFVCLRHGANFPSLTYTQNQLTSISNIYPEIEFGKKIRCAPLFNAIAEFHFRVSTGWEAMKCCAKVKSLSLLAEAIKHSPLCKRFDQKTLEAWAKAPLIYKNGAAYGPRKNSFNDIEQYKTYYQPPNWSGYNLQKKAFENLLKFAESKQIQVVVVDMPLTKTNLALLDPALLKAYTKDVTNITDKHHASFLDLKSSSDFQDSDFEDSVHLNEFGGQKFFNTLADHIAHSYFESAPLMAEENVAQDL